MNSAPKPRPTMATLMRFAVIWSPRRRTVCEYASSGGVAEIAAHHSASSPRVSTPNLEASGQKRFSRPLRLRSKKRQVRKGRGDQGQFRYNSLHLLRGLG